MSDIRSPLSKARDEWLDSKEGQLALDAGTLGMNNPKYYMRNRLEKAFHAGANWKERKSRKGRKNAS